ncbi:MAG TPA: hypothetical protein VGF55_29415 [Gemmataceae bacterium]|jgi:hypothetical protein
MRRLLGVMTALVVVGVGEPPSAADKPQVFTGKVVQLAAPPGKSAGVALAGDDGTTYPLIEDDASRMLFLDGRLRNRPVRLTAVRKPGTKDLRVVLVQTVKDGKVYDVDYWCDICQISTNYPGKCVCCGDDTELRERPAK